MAHENELDYHESEFNNASEFQSHLMQRIFEERASGIVKQIVYTNVQQPWAIDTVNTLEQNGLVCFKHYDPSTKVFRVQTMTTQLHNAAQEWFSRSREKWLLNKTITQAERDMLTATADSLFQFTSGPFAGASKAPNLAVQLVGIGWPGVIFECGYSQSHDSLLDDVTDWLVGSDGKTRAIVLVDWSSSQTTMTVRGNVELYTLDRDGMPRLRQREVFPAPTGLFKELQDLKMTRRHFFGANIAGDREPDDIFDLDIEVLRTVTTELMANMGYAPA